MNDSDVFWRLEALTDRQLLERLSSVLGSSRRLMAELIAHLGEVEERRLHLAAACSSLFAYCLKLGMTEDEAYRRIEVARLARRYPAIFPLLANGYLSISALALLKHHLSDQNHLELLAAVTGKSVAQTRDLIAARFPRPDVASSVRQLPERRTMNEPQLAVTPLTETCTGRTAPDAGGMPPNAGRTVTHAAAPCGGDTRSDETAARGTEPRRAEPPAGRTEPPQSMSTAPPHRPSRIEPLSAQRYKVQLTASAELARKLQLATDLMRHSHPSGELGPILERAVDLLIEQLMRRRFGSKKASTKPTSERDGRAATDRRYAIRSGPSTMHRARRAPPTEHDTRPADAAPPDPVANEHDAKQLDAVDSRTMTPDSGHVQDHRRGELTGASASPYIPRSTRRTVLERHGLGCSWVDEHGVRCGSRAWLEYDHRHPRAKGGGSEPDNLRLLCRGHNRFAAEREYGRKHVEQTIAKRRRERAPDPSHAI